MNTFTGLDIDKTKTDLKQCNHIALS